MESLVPPPARGRTFSSRRRARLSDLDPRGRVRLDALARFLQDAAIEDVDETGWGLPDHLWFIRSIRVDVTAPFVADRELELLTWSSGRASIAAGRRWSVRGDRGGSVEVDSVWIHLGPDERPARIDDFGPYGASAGDRAVSTKLELPDPPVAASRLPWSVRVADIDLHGHLNNAVYWQAVEDRLVRRGPDPAQPLRAQLEYRSPIEVDDAVHVFEWSEDESDVHVAFATPEAVKAVARVSSPPA